MNLTQAHKKLQEAMDGLKVIPVDKSQLRKLVDDSRKYVEKLNEYTAKAVRFLWEHLRRLKIF